MVEGPYLVWGQLPKHQERLRVTDRPWVHWNDSMFGEWYAQQRHSVSEGYKQIGRTASRPIQHDLTGFQWERDTVPMEVGQESHHCIWISCKIVSIRNRTGGYTCAGNLGKVERPNKEWAMNCLTLIIAKRIFPLKRSSTVTKAMLICNATVLKLWVSLQPTPFSIDITWMVGTNKTKHIPIRMCFLATTIQHQSYHRLARLSLQNDHK